MTPLGKITDLRTARIQCFEDISNVLTRHDAQMQSSTGRTMRFVLPKTDKIDQKYMYTLTTGLQNKLNNVHLQDAITISPDESSVLVTVAENYLPVFRKAFERVAVPKIILREVQKGSVSIKDVKPNKLIFSVPQPRVTSTFPSKPNSAQDFVTFLSAEIHKTVGREPVHEILSDSQNGFFELSFTESKMFWRVFRALKLEKTDITKITNEEEKALVAEYRKTFARKSKAG